VFLLGGSSGTGKTSVASALAREYGVPHALADGYRLALARATTAATHPALHPARATAPADLTAAALCAQWRRAAAAVSQALEVTVAFHAATDAAMLLEGDVLLPSLMATGAPAGVPVGARVRGAVLWEPAREQIEARMRARARGFVTLSAAQQRREVERSWLYGSWLRDEAAGRGVPVVEVGPTLADTVRRVRAAAGA
jgi:2-phosphoglycerate kinase